ncbi:hypothetical protein HK099_006203 [Clydaea vesicula]|uniref:ERCC4 domain-containing protein n=1 Tax=Clydaea vesicula TaxID=447962 RepID=A0AAD5Y0Y2_9FUNG|nr:hypothetical protein HK099_006203 [Clydaea vesicula]
MLNKVVPLPLVAGIMVNHAHRVSENSTEAFIIKLYKQENNLGFIKGFSSQPESFTNGIWKLEKTMKLLFVRKVFLWPRFHHLVNADLQQGQINLVELRVPLTRKMKDIQAALIECIKDCIGEIKRGNPSLDMDEFLIENSFFKSFDTIVKAHLDPVWHKISTKTKKLVTDLKTLRKLLTYLLNYDCVSFHSFLEALHSSNFVKTQYSFTAAESPWLLMDAAHTIFTSARERVYKKIPADGNATLTRTGNFLGVPMRNFDIILEEQPKWRVLKDIMFEIEKEKSTRKEEKKEIGKILIMAEEERTCVQLREILEDLDFTIIKTEKLEESDDTVFVINDFGDVEPEKEVKKQKLSVGGNRRRLRGGSNSNVRRPSIVKPKKHSKEDFYTKGSEKLLRRSIRNYFFWKTNLANITKNKDVNSKDNSNNLSMSLLKFAAQRRRVRVKNKNLEEPDIVDVATLNPEGIEEEDDNEVENIVEEFIISQQPANNQTDQSDEQMMEPVETVKENDFIIRRYATTSHSIIGGTSSNGDDDSRFLEDCNPMWIILYEPDVSFIRRLEVYKAANPDVYLKVFFMVYDNSVEEQKYLTKIRREKEAFEKLIKQKSMMAISLDTDGRVRHDEAEDFWDRLDNKDTRNAGGQREKNTPLSVVVDIREFQSSLPYSLFSQRLQLKPCTLEVGDYILTPEICVERKSIPDLIGSFRSGRLTVQCEAMSSHYKYPTLLIEFDQNQCFSLDGSGFVVFSLTGRQTKKELSNFDLQSKIILLSMTFPKLKIIWSAHSQATAEIFKDLKKKAEEPNVEQAMKIGVENTETLNSDFNPTPYDILRSLPGVNYKNYRLIMSKVPNLKTLAFLSEVELQKIIGDENGRKLFNYFRHDSRGTI